MEFRVVVEAQQDMFHAYCPNLRGCHSWGQTPEEAMQYMEEALQYYVDNFDGALDPFDEGFIGDPFDLPPIMN
jgi:predicted RNase H-like HicB family nuclease